MVAGGPAAGRARGLQPGNGNGIDRIWDFTVAEGGPIMKDKLWFFAGVAPAFVGWVSDRIGRKSLIAVFSIASVARPLPHSTFQARM